MEEKEVKVEVISKSLKKRKRARKNILTTPRKSLLSLSKRKLPLSSNKRKLPLSANKRMIAIMYTERARAATITSKINKSYEIKTIPEIKLVLVLK